MLLNCHKSDYRATGNGAYVMRHATVYLNLTYTNSLAAIFLFASE